jgi:very-short-patch-repair endonuclease
MEVKALRNSENDSLHEWQPEYKTDLARQMRREPTGAEAMLWESLRGRRLMGLKFRRQHPLGRFVTDFCCPEARLIVELDGAVHDRAEQRAYDDERDTYLRARRFRVLRFPNRTVANDLPAILAAITAAATAHNAEIQSPPLPSLGEGEGG